MPAAISSRAVSPWAIMAAATPASKLRKVHSLLGLRNLSGSDVARVLEALDGERPQGTRKLVRGELDSLKRDLVHAISLGEGSVEAARLQSLLPRVLSVSPAFHELVRAVLRRFPNSRDRPWRLVLYVDEITLGNVQKTANMRRMKNVYASFLEC